ncbi:CoA pyrophosphatase [Ktedonosporobacter rubrisoli]|uniref:CoA pyrophosphatase n=1 Tax=Ktedonosporobacter rubrisoli TaxID=2509675 RepID=A0A4P6K2P6_KTERU|nr:CoA pyrophosphatase [Ktedonosporobacter rubrisoli]QBD81980.1 CoA pyrophosphatase [Ktedonosporobacter rubrisoli]
MKTFTTSEVLRVLRKDLIPLREAEKQVDAVEGQLPNARKAAVLIPLFEQDEELYTLFIRRATTLRAHSGEIAFPGGGMDPQDLSLEMTALREAQEEVGLAPERVKVLGGLGPVFTVVSNYVITPVVAFLPQGLGPLRMQDSEVTELIPAPLRVLADPAIFHTEQWARDNRVCTVYFYDYGAYHIWGATGRMLNSLLEILRTSKICAS